MNRRSFLRHLWIAPVAVPVALAACVDYSAKIDPSRVIAVYGDGFFYYSDPEPLMVKWSNHGDFTNWNIKT